MADTSKTKSKTNSKSDPAKVDMHQADEVSAYINTFLKEVGLPVSDPNRALVLRHMEEYADQQKGTVFRDGLTMYIKNAIRER